MSRGKLVVVVAGVLAGVLVAGLAVSADAKRGGRPLDANLTGEAERPGPGDLAASGSADLRLNQGQRRICFELDWQNLTDGEPFAAHIHEAPVTDAGPIVVNLFVPPSPPLREGCTENVDRGLIKDIRKNPEDYYVNVHTLPNFPGGAIRGQLSK